MAVVRGKSVVLETIPRRHQFFNLSSELIMN